MERIIVDGKYIYIFFWLPFISISNKQLFYVNLSFEPFKLFESGRKGGSFLESWMILGHKSFP